MRLQCKTYLLLWVATKKLKAIENKFWDFPSGPVAKTPCS